MTEPNLPKVAVVGRPNVGKSTLVNRLAQRTDSIVGPMAGLTRDRLSVEAEWRGRRVTLKDTGGLPAGARGADRGADVTGEGASGGLGGVGSA